MTARGKRAEEGKTLECSPTRELFRKSIMIMYEIIKTKSAKQY